jgi:hypothetical protein
MSKLLVLGALAIGGALAAPSVDRAYTGWKAKFVENEKILEEAKSELAKEQAETALQLAAAARDAVCNGAGVNALADKHIVRDKGTKANGTAVATITASEGHFILATTVAYDRSGSSDVVYDRLDVVGVAAYEGTAYADQFLVSASHTVRSSDHSIVPVHATAAAQVSAAEYPNHCMKYFMQRDAELADRYIASQEDGQPNG